MSNNEIVQKLWNLCDVLRDDGINYADYVTELVLLLFIKMEHENAQSGVMAAHKLPEGARWTDIAKLSGLNLLNHYQGHAARPFARARPAARRHLRRRANPHSKNRATSDS